MFSGPQRAANAGMPDPLSVKSPQSGASLMTV
jgi:hypothetical protein